MEELTPFAVFIVFLLCVAVCMVIFPIVLLAVIS